MKARVGLDTGVLVVVLGVNRRNQELDLGLWDPGDAINAIYRTEEKGPELEFPLTVDTDKNGDVVIKDKNGKVVKLGV